MATVNMFRGGTPDFKPMFCAGDFPEFTQPFSSPHYKWTPPFNSHADGALNQGFLTQVFPLVPNLQNNDAHKWQRIALQGVKAVGDIIFLNWVPLRSYWISQYIEVTETDPLLDGVYVKPVAYRFSWDVANKTWKQTENTAYAAKVAAANVTQFPLGTPAEGDSRYGIIDLMPEEGEVPCTFGHNLLKADGSAGLDAYYGGVVFGLQVSAGDPAKVAEMWNGNFALYNSAKLLTFECSMQVG